MQYVTLNTGAKMPMEGFGVFRVPDLKQCEDSVYEAIRVGYRLIDTATAYKNEEAVGAAVRSAIADGICIAIDDGVIQGIITDGDIRRAMQYSKSDFFHLRVGDVMTHNPKTVPPTMKIVDIDNILNQNKIHCVLVTDADNHLLGVVDSFSTVL